MTYTATDRAILKAIQDALTAHDTAQADTDNSIVAGIANCRVDHQQITQNQVNLDGKLDVATQKIDGFATAQATYNQQLTAAMQVLAQGLVTTQQALATQTAVLQQILGILGEDTGTGGPSDPPVWGFNAGGYSQTHGETQAAALTRIEAVFGPIQAIRWWVNSFFNWTQLAATAYADVPRIVANLGSDIAGINAGNYDNAFAAICHDATQATRLTAGHEPEDDPYSLADWQNAQIRLAAIKTDVGNPLVKFGPLLMGASYHATRYQGTGPNPMPASVRLGFNLINCDFIGADCYQWGHADADADHADAVIGPVVDLARQLEKPILIGELGARRRSTVSDSIRARWFQETKAIVDNNPGMFDTICIYESDRGASDKIPWNILPYTGDPMDPNNSPQAVTEVQHILSR